MPRLPPSLLRHATAVNALLPRLLRECRDLPSAENELRWLTEFARYNPNVSCLGRNRSAYHQLSRYVERRSRGEPLQYILGSQPFGELDILCRPGVLIPRPETEVYTIELAKLIISACQGGYLCKGQQLAIADLCTGSGCISLLLYSLLRSALPGQDADGPNSQAADLTLHGVDVSSKALELAADNLGHNIASHTLPSYAKNEIKFHQLDVLTLGEEAAARLLPSAAASVNNPSVHDHSSATTSFLAQQWPVIVSNPPYISPHDYALGGSTARSVRSFEPKLALVPSDTATGDYRHLRSVGSIEQADVFYAALLYLAQAVRTEILLMEVGDLKQAMRVMKLTRQILQASFNADTLQGGLTIVETWRDDSSVKRWDVNNPVIENDSIDDSNASTRAVVVWHGAAAEWRKAQREG